MNSPVLITWLGHSCFLLECRGYRLLLDPYQDGNVPGYAPLRVEADEVLCSHGHGDHNFVEAASLRKNPPPSPFAVRALDCPHDDARGAKRGMTKIHLVEAGELRIAHFGDIGCPLTEAQAAEIGSLDAAMIPVGGHYTIDAAGARELVKRLSPTVVIPMHYREGGLGYRVLAALDEYTRLCGDLVRYEKNSIELTKSTPKQTAVLRYQA